MMLFAKYSLSTRPHAAVLGWCTWPYFTKTARYQSFPLVATDELFDHFFKLTVDHHKGGGLHAPSTDVLFMGFIYASDRQLGFALDRTWVPACHFVDVTIPLYFPLALTIPGMLNWLLKLAKRQSGNLCVACGYDLRATPDRCPECGTIPAKT